MLLRGRLELLHQHPAIKFPLFFQGMRQVLRLAEPMPLSRIKVPFSVDPVGLQRCQHGPRLFRHHHCIQLTLEENHRHLDALCMQQRRALAIAVSVPLRVADQPVQIITLELVGGTAQGYRVADPVQAGAGAKHVLERQSAQGGVAPGTAAADERLAFVDHALSCQVFDYRAGIGHIALAPALVQCLAVFPTIAGAAPVVEVGHGKAALGPILDTRVEHGITG